MTKTTEPRRLAGWPLTALVLGVLVLLLVAAVFWAFFRLPGRAVRAGTQVVEELQELAEAFTQGTVTHQFLSHSTEISGSTHLQVATLEQTEIFVLEDAASTLWGVVALPTVEVRATAPVTFTYFLDLDGAWNFELRDGRVRVVAPRLRWNRPAIDVSNLEYEVLQGSLLRDEEEVLTTLRREIMGRSAIQASKNIQLVRETARRQAEGFVEVWLLHHFDGAEQYPVELLFADEVAGELPPLSVQGEKTLTELPRPSTGQEVP